LASEGIEVLRSKVAKTLVWWGWIVVYRWVVLWASIGIALAGCQETEPEAGPQTECVDRLDCDFGHGCIEGRCIDDSTPEPDVVEPPEEDVPQPEPEPQPDASEPDVPPVEDATEDTPEPPEDVPEPEEDIVEGALSAEVLEPMADQTFEEGDSVVFVATVLDPRFEPSLLSVRLISDLDGTLWEGNPDAEGQVRWTGDALSSGAHRLTLEARNPLDEVIFATRRIAVCSWGTAETFDVDIEGSGWVIYGDASWDPGGWLEMTGPLRDRKGAIFNVQERIAPGDISIRFRIWTGGGSGADGFAMSVFDAVDRDALESLIASAANGGGLGYGVGGNYGNFAGDAFHVEFDTWENRFNGTTELHSDPTSENHIAVMLDGDPGDHRLWAEIPTIEDQQWHEVIIDIEGTFVTVLLDSEIIVMGDIPGLDFKGGFIGFSGTTGFFTNYHRFDELQLLQECRVP
jgi:hypothetical protein